MSHAPKAAMTARELAKLLAVSGLTKAEAAERLGVTRRTLSRWEHGHVPIRPAVAAYVRSKLAPQQSRKILPTPR